MPKCCESDTIAAISTPVGEGGIGIVRLSGPESSSIAERVFKRKASGPWESHRLYYGHVFDPGNSRIVDEALCVLMKAPKSYTREDVLEIYCHGGSLATQRVLEMVMKVGARAAEPGEFTKRAFLNGRIDLTQAEAVIDLIRAKGPAGQAAATEQLKGRLFERLNDIKSKLSAVLAHSEAYIDFPEEDIQLSTREDFLNVLSEADRLLNELVVSYDEGKVYRDGLSIVIAGRPNVGKSSLLNLLLKEKRAIVTSVPGTTRDIIEEYMSIRGVPLRLADTAGIRETDDLVEKEGVRLAKEVLDRADIALFVVDGSVPITDEDLMLSETLKNKKGILVVNKSDTTRLLTDDDVGLLKGKMPAVFISAATGEGLENLYDAIFMAAIGGSKEPSGLVVTRARHRDSMQKASDAIRSAAEGIRAGMSLEFTAIDLRTALEALREIVGETTSEDILEKIFSEFCIGK